MALFRRVPWLRHRAARRTDRRFDELDRNRDGHVTIEEWGTDAQGFQALDRDRSGLLSRDEVDGADDAPADLFGSLDANRDGRVTRDEWRWSRRRLRPSRHRS